MTEGAIARGAIALLFATSSCGSNERETVLTVDEFIPQIDRLNGKTASVTGYLPGCAGYDCLLYRNRAEADRMDRFIAAARSNKGPPLPPFPDVPIVGIGSGANFDFDAKAAPFTRRYVVITGLVTNKCRFKGRPACRDRTTDLRPTAIRAAT